MPGKQNSCSDALSRHPDSHNQEEQFVSLINSMSTDSPELTEFEHVDQMNVSVSSIQSDLNKVYAITWARAKQATTRN